MAAGVAMMGVSELMFLFLFAGGMGLPMGTPPEKEDPVMAYVAPEKCLLYTSWAGMAKPDADSANQTEQMLAEPEIREFAIALEKTLALTLAKLNPDTTGEDEQAKKRALMIKLAPTWAKTLITRPTAIFVSKLAPQGATLDIEGGLITQAGDNAALLVDSLFQLLSGEDGEPESVTIKGTKFYKSPGAPDHLPQGFLFGHLKGYLLIGLGKGSLEAMLDRIAAKKTPAWLTTLQEQLPVERRSTTSYANVQKLVAVFAPLGGPEVEKAIQALGLSQITTLESITGMDATGMVGKSLVGIDGQAKGILKLLDGPGLTAADLAHLPTDAMSATAFQLNMEQAIDVADELIHDLLPNQGDWEGMKRTLKDSLGLELKEDLLSALGGTWTLSTASGDGWFTGLIATVSVRDQVKLAVAIEKLMGALRRQEDAPVQFKKLSFANQEIHYLTSNNFPLPFQPSFCITEKRLIVALIPQTIKAALSRKAGEKSLADAPQFSGLQKPAGTVVAATYNDTAKWFEFVYSYVTLFANMFSNPNIFPGGLHDGPEKPAPWFDAAMLPSARSISKHLRPSTTVFRRTPRGLETETHQTHPVANIGATVPVGVALLLPAVQSARTSARRMASANNLKQIGLAMHTFHDVYKAFPAAFNSTADGKPLLSWRVHLLPMLEEQQLYDQFHFDEPWDSEHNKTLIAKMPKVYAAPGGKAGEGKTNYLGVRGKDCTFVPPSADEKGKEHPQGIRMSSILDGTSNTIMVVEASDESAVIWTNPGDLEPDEKDPLKGLIGLRAGGFLALFCDGSVHFLPQKITAKTLRCLFSRNDGEAVEVP